MTLKVSDKIKEKKMYDNLDDDKIGELKNGDNKKKKRDKHDTNEKELLKNYEKKEREKCMIT